MDSELTITHQEQGLPCMLCNCVKISTHFSAVLEKEKTKRDKLNLQGITIPKAIKVIRHMEGLPQEDQLNKSRDFRWERNEWAYKAEL